MGVFGPEHPLNRGLYIAQGNLAQKIEKECIDNTVPVNRISPVFLKLSQNIGKDRSLCGLVHLHNLEGPDQIIPPFDGKCLKKFENHFPRERAVRGGFQLAPFS